ncbi:sulfotransferase family protein [Streptomyces sp. NPDC054855]
MSGGEPPGHKVFGIGLSRTGTQSLTAALHVLGYNVVHYPADEDTYRTLLRGDARFPLLTRHDGITDITTVPYVAQLDRAWPGAKFVLTVRDEALWLRSCARHWSRPPHRKTEYGERYLSLQLFLRAAVYGCHTFDEDRFRHVHRRHLAEVRALFADRPDSLLILDPSSPDPYARLAAFLGRPVPKTPYPHEGRWPA